MLLGASIIVLGLGIYRIRENIYGPFKIVYNNANRLSASEQELKKLNDLKNQDTDADSLSDYDELYQYKTSPYLSDSDSDTYSDKQEIESGNDPNCPEGKECIQERVMVDSSNANIPLESAVELRETLRKAGVPQTILDQTDDATLLEVYKDTLQKTQTNTNDDFSEFLNVKPFPNVNASSSLDQLKNLNASEVREFLQQSGLDATVLDQVDDDTLMNIFNQSLNQ